MKLITLLTLPLLLSGCMATDLREVRQSQPIVTQIIQGAYRPLARCAFDAFEAKTDGTHWGVYQLREDESPPSSRLASFGPGMDYWVLMVYASIATRFELAFTPKEPAITQLEYRAAWTVGDMLGKQYFETSVFPIIKLCSPQQAAPATAPPAATASPK